MTVVQVTRCVVPEAVHVLLDITMFLHPTHVNAVSYAMSSGRESTVLTEYKVVHIFHFELLSE